MSRRRLSPALSHARTGLLGALALASIAGAASAQVATVPTTNTDALRTALQGNGVTITQIIVKNGAANQIGTFSNFRTLPVTIHNGVCLSSGDVTNLAPLPEVLDPAYDPASPPQAVNNWMVLDPPEATGGTPEFDAYGGPLNSPDSRIQNFGGSYDVAALEVHFTIPEDSQVQFDFLFGSVEFPFYTGQFTDAFLVFLDGTDPINQITYDAAGAPVQVGVSFANLVTTNDVNSAFAAPHGLIHHLTTTTERLSSGEHTIIFEVGDVNDHILDSVAFITNLRTGVGTQGTESSEDDCGPADVAGLGSMPGHDARLTVDDIVFYINRFFAADLAVADIAGIGGTPHSDGEVTVDDLVFFLDQFFEGCS